MDCTAAICVWQSSSILTLQIIILQHPFTFIFNAFHYVFWEFPYAFPIGKFCTGFEG